MEIINISQPTRRYYFNIVYYKPSGKFSFPHQPEWQSAVVSKNVSGKGNML